jgi:aldose 1-epimerase
MRFKASTINQDNETIILLTDKVKGCLAEIYTYGAILNSFSIKTEGKDFNIKDHYTRIADAKERLATWFNSARLSPFVCRLNRGEYCIENTVYKIEKFYMGNHAIHGLVYDASYTIHETIANDEMAAVTLYYQYAATDKGYPFIFESYITYTLKKDNSIYISSKIINKSETAVPFTEGWHPYFNLEGISNDWTLQINSNTAVEFDTEMIPTGKLKVDNSFITPAKIGGTHLDNCYFIYDHSTPACVLSNNRISLSIFPEESMPYLQVFTPDHRKSIAIECLSGTADSFNNKFGLVWIKPEESHSFNTLYQLSKG